MGIVMREMSQRLSWGRETIRHARDLSCARFQKYFPGPHRLTRRSDTPSPPGPLALTWPSAPL